MCITSDRVGVEPVDEESPWTSIYHEFFFLSSGNPYPQTCAVGFSSSSSINRLGTASFFKPSVSPPPVPSYFYVDIWNNHCKWHQKNNIVSSYGCWCLCLCCVLAVSSSKKASKGGGGGGVDCASLVCTWRFFNDTNKKSNLLIKHWLTRMNSDIKPLFWIPIYIHTTIYLPNGIPCT